MTAAAERLSAVDLVAFETEVARVFNAGRICAPIHLHDGNEEALIEIFRREVRDEDWVLSSWRSHYHCLLKGVPPPELMAEIMAGRSIALNFPEHRVVSSAMVGGVLPIAVGIAWAAKRAGSGERVWCFLGDMTAATGIAHESAAYARNHRLPIVFVIEDNGISVCTPTDAAWGGPAPSLLSSRNVRRYRYVSRYPHAGTGKRIEF
jgi:pyruvate dehydrogenase E1 component alpha subunit